MGIDFYPSPFKKKPIKYKTVGDPEAWVEENLQWFCPIWSAKIANPRLCNERKGIAKSEQNRFSMGDSHHFTTMHTCNTCSGPVPIEEMEAVKQKTEKEKKLLWLTAYLSKEEQKETKMQAEEIEKPKKKYSYQKPPKPKVPLGTPSVCTRCGEEFEAWQSGRMTVHKVCKNCVGHKDRSKSLVETLKDVVTPVPELLADKIMEAVKNGPPYDPILIMPEKQEEKIYTPGSLEEEMQRIEENMRKKKYPPSEVPDMEANNTYEVSDWIGVLFENEYNLLDKLTQDATKNRRSFIQHILFILEQQFRDDPDYLV